MAWFKLNRNVSPTKAATDLYNEMLAGGIDVINLGQGRETVELPILKKLMSEINGVKISSAYPAAPVEIEKSLEAWTKRFFGVEGTCIAAMAAQGRYGLDRIFHQAALNFDFKGEVLGPDSSWPMVNDLIRDYGQVMSLYPMERGRIASHLNEKLASNHNISCVYINPPHNPTGMKLTLEEMREIMAVMEHYNSDEWVSYNNGKKIMLAIDNPYFASCDIGGEGAILSSGLEGVLMPDTKTPWVMDLSFSKAFGLATPGFSALISHPELAKVMGPRMLRNAKLGYVGEVFDAINKTLQPEQDSNVIEHFSGLNHKYGQNWSALNRTLANIS